MFYATYEALKHQEQLQHRSYAERLTAWREDIGIEHVTQQQVEEFARSTQSRVN